MKEPKTSYEICEKCGKYTKVYHSQIGELKYCKECIENMFMSTYEF